ncbi:50S ribosomal protein L6 [Chitinispirillales bacterium ANBcel5]|uniref:50S ribosomal protein L6 n=1 Tax=Cellulosispirillum alkaliphilum TaxID=3039283 RepID=UPI002A58A0EF|nr:50S ribosomal protein L6 [Chitinispirillales bacterium ANBcel5]
MSRIGKLPVKIPSGVQVKLEGQLLEVKGTKGTLSREVPDTIKVEISDSELKLNVTDDTRETKALWGLYRVLINNMIIGVTTGYKRELEVVGVGYKAELKGKDLNISAGLSSPVLFKARPGVTLGIDGPTKIVVEGIDKQAVGQVAADIRKIRPPEPYKGKGIRYAGEQIRRKAGKAAK